MGSKHISHDTQMLIICNQPKNMFPQEIFSYIYEERALLMADSNDIVVLRNNLPNEYIEFIKSNNRFEIITIDSNCNDEELTDALLKDNNLQLIKNKLESSSSKILLQSYIPDEKIGLLAHKLGVQVCGKKFFYENYKKSIINDLCSTLRLNTINSEYLRKYEDMTSNPILDFINKYKKVIIKPEVGLGGQFVRKENATDTMGSMTTTVFPLIIQEFLPAQVEGSIQFFKSSKKWDIYLCETFQKNFQFCGYKYPYSNINHKELIVAAQKFLDYFVNKYAGDMPSFGIDFIISNNKIYFHDINPRNTGVTYIFSLLHHIYGESILQSVQCMYLQIKYDHPTTYSELRKKIESFGLEHITKNITEGYALLYPGMLKNKILNILLVSKNNNIKEYKKLINKILD